MPPRSGLTQLVSHLSNPIYPRPMESKIAWAVSFFLIYPDLYELEFSNVQSSQALAQLGQASNTNSTCYSLY